MLGLQFFKYFRGICRLQIVLVAENINVRTARSPSLNLTKARQNSCCYFSVLPQGLVKLNEMQRVTWTDYAVELETNNMEHGNDHLLSPAHDASTDPVAAEESHLHCNVKDIIAPEHDIVKRIKKKPKKPRGRKHKSKSSECSDNFMSELPFTSTAIWKDLGFTKPEAKLKIKRKRGASGRVESEEDADTKKKKETQRPNYFVSIPITNPKISEGVGVVQALVMQRDSRLTRALVPVGSLHITLLVTHLASQEEVNLAACAVAQMKAELQDLLRGRELILPFHGIGHFRNEVAFVELAQGEHLATLAQITGVVRKTFEEKGLSSGDGKAFKPHLTFMKLSKAPKLRSQGVKKLDPELYSDYAQHHFGDERVIRLDLCSMLKKKMPDGYYHQEASVTFDLFQSGPRAARTSVKRGPEPDDEELVSLSKRLVEDAVLRAVQQFMDETQHNGAVSSDPVRPSDNLNTNAVNTTTTDTSASSK
ncbi:A-kinase anchor protein 7 isoform X1 [Coregonus clupeaformis]|uniref:A-kinase anchor protein 7 isoform X1 n=2 Tax=Coregonus clupeaformis TaxID=59861 RepID=UPI001BE06CE1|nr:A-kinase anchor protein 7 isoform X1 [Coregonus clupeaformis]